MQGYSSTISDIKCTTDPFEPKLLYSNEENSISTVLCAISGYGRKENIIKVHVYQVCENSGMLPFFQLAIEKLKETNRSIFNMLQLEYMTNNEIRKKQYTPEDIGDWLMKSDIHFILSHIHQGLLTEDYNVWTPATIEHQLSRLQSHRGFPSGLCMKCPIFTQDKHHYLWALQDMALPTLKVPIPIDVNNLEVKEKISQ